MARARARTPLPKTRETTKQETRDALVTAGMELFAKEGLDAPSLDAICARAGFTRGAFYVHFADRDAFLEAVMERVGREFLDGVLGSAGDGTDLARTVARFVTAMASGEYPLTRDEGVRPHQLLDACARSPSIRARYVGLVDESLRRVTDRVAEGQRAGVVRDDVRADIVSTLLHAVVIGAQTMLELRVPLDTPGGAATVLTLLAAPHGSKKAKKSKQRR